MRIFKNKLFNKWAGKEGISDQALKDAVSDMSNGLIDANLGGNLFKTRVAVSGKGKSGGVRICLPLR